MPLGLDVAGAGGPFTSSYYAAAYADIASYAAGCLDLRRLLLLIASELLLELPKMLLKFYSLSYG